MKLSTIAVLLLPAVLSGCFLFDSPNGVEGAGGAFSDDDDDDDDAPLNSGIYLLTDSAVEQATCGVTTAAVFAQFSEVQISASSNFVEMIFDGGEAELVYDVSHDVFGTPTLQEESSPWGYDVDFGDPTTYSYYGLQFPADCVLAFTGDFPGFVLNPYTFELGNEFRYEVSSGAECSAAATSAGFMTLPCADIGNTTWSAL